MKKIDCHNRVVEDYDVRYINCGMEIDSKNCAKMRVMKKQKETKNKKKDTLSS